MKKFLASFAILAALAVPRFAFAYSWGDLGTGIVNRFQAVTTDVQENAHFSFLGGVEPMYGWSLAYNEHKIGAKTAFLGYKWQGKYKIITADAGYEPGALNEMSKVNGTALIGGTIHIDQIITAAFPDKVDLLKSLLLPASALPFWDAVSIGFSPAYDFGRDRPDYQITSGLFLKFGS